MNKKEENFKKIVLEEERTLSNFEENSLNIELKNIESQIEFLHERITNLGRLKNYNELKKNGFDLNHIREFYKKDQEVIDNANELINKHFEKDHDYMFGYPANMSEDSYVVKYLRWLEAKLYFMNSCGNAYSKGNYRMNNSNQELKIIEKIKDNLNLNKADYWGYITMGGTEGNMWGIREGFSRYPHGILYYSDASHYSVAKMSDMKEKEKYEIISSTKEKINVDELLYKIINNYNEKKAPAILLLTFGTTTFGSIDDIKTIVTKLKELNIPYYVHVDAALYGGIPNNQKFAPINKFNELSKLDIDSISVSLHKYIGNHRVNGVLLSRSKSYQKFIEYIGQQDITFLGSRDFPSFSILQRIDELFNRSNENEFQKNVKYFEYLLNEYNINFIKGEISSNIFVIEKPNQSICEKYQLATFKRNDIDYAHIIIFPYHKKEIILELVKDISEDKEKANNCYKKIFRRQ